MTTTKIIFVIIIFVFSCSCMSLRHYKKLFQIQKKMVKQLQNNYTNKSKINDNSSNNQNHHKQQKKWHKDYQLNELLQKIPKSCFFYKDQSVFFVCLHFAENHLELSPIFHKIHSDNTDNIENIHVTNVMNMKSELDKLNCYKFTSIIYSRHNKTKLIQDFKHTIKHFSTNTTDHHMLKNIDQEIFIIHATVNEFLNMIENENEKYSECVLKKCFIFM